MPKTEWKQYNQVGEISPPDLEMLARADALYDAIEQGDYSALGDAQDVVEFVKRYRSTH